jgi:hypothetical protein
MLRARGGKTGMFVGGTVWYGIPSLKTDRLRTPVSCLTLGKILQHGKSPAMAGGR